MTIRGMTLAIVVGAITLTALPASGNSSKSACKSMFSYIETKNFAIEQCADRKNAYIIPFAQLRLFPRRGDPLTSLPLGGKSVVVVI
jgi:hypothetical protein